MAQGLAWEARRRGVRCTVVVPDHAPAAKLAAIQRLGATFVKVPFEAWWQILVDRTHPGMEGLFIHPTADAHVVAGDGTIGLEIFEDLPDAGAVLVPWGGGGLSCGIASALHAAGSPAKVYACEVETAAPFSASLAAGRPTTTPYTPSFIDGIGGRSVFPELWNLATRELAGSLVVSVAEAAAAVRYLVSRARIVAEGAGAVPVAAALALERGAQGAPRTPGGKAPAGKVVCVVSGGNIDAAVLARILGGAPG